MNIKRLSVAMAWLLIFALLFGASAWATEIKSKDGTLIVEETEQDKLPTSRWWLKYHDMEWAQRASAVYTGLAITSGIAALSSLVTGIAVRSAFPGAGNVLILVSLGFGVGTVLCFRKSTERAELARRLRQELEGRALLAFKDEDNRLCLRIQTPSVEVDSETGRLEWNLISYGF